MLNQELHVADEMSQAELQRHVFIQLHVLAVRAEVIAAQDAVELRPQHLD